MKPTEVAKLAALADRTPAYALVEDVDLVVVRFGDAVSVLYGRCLRRGALMSDGHAEGDDLICGVQAFCADDLTTFNRDLAYLSGVAYGGVVPL